MDEREKFYGKFLQHASEGALQAVAEAHARITGRPLSQAARERVSVILIDGLTAFQNMRPRRLSPFDEMLARRIAEASTDDCDSIESMQREALEAVRRLIANFAESLVDFIREVRPDSNK